jgi:hypothetical protein
MAAFTQEKKAEDMIEIGVGEEHAFDWRIACFSRRWLERRKRLDLRAQVGRCVDEEPALAIRAEGNAGLRTRMNCAGARLLTIRAGTIPLRQATAGRGS